MNKLAWDRAVLNFPKYFEDPLQFMRANGGITKYSYRDRGIGQLSFAATEHIIVRMGCRYFVTMTIAPEIMYIVEKQGFICVSEVSYTEAGQDFSLTPEEFEAKKHLFKDFKNGKPVIRFYVKDLTPLLKEAGINKL